MQNGADNLLPLRLTGLTRSHVGGTTANKRQWISYLTNREPMKSGNIQRIRGACTWCHCPSRDSKQKPRMNTVYAMYRPQITSHFHHRLRPSSNPCDESASERSGTQSRGADTAPLCNPSISAFPISSRAFVQDSRQAWHHPSSHHISCGVPQGASSW